MTKEILMTKSEGTREYDDSFWLDGETYIIREERKRRRFTIWKSERRGSVRWSSIFARTIPRDSVTDRIISQLVGAGTSVGANYIEADDSVSKKEFLKCIGTARRRRVKRSIFCAWQSAQSKTKTGSAKAADESEGIASDFCEDLADRKTKGTREMTKHPPSLRCGATGE